MDHERSALTFIQVGAMTPSVGAMGMGRLRRKSGAGLGFTWWRSLTDIGSKRQRWITSGRDWQGLALAGWFDRKDAMPVGHRSKEK